MLAEQGHPASHWRFSTDTNAGSALNARHIARNSVYICALYLNGSILHSLEASGQVIEIITYFVGLLECCLALLLRIFLSFGGIIMQSYQEMGRWWFCKIKE